MVNKLSRAGDHWHDRAIGPRVTINIAIQLADTVPVFPADTSAIKRSELCKTIAVNRLCPWVCITAMFAYPTAICKYFRGCLGCAFVSRWESLPFGNGGFSIFPSHSLQSSALDIFPFQFKSHLSAVSLPKIVSFPLGGLENSCGNWGCCCVISCWWKWSWQNKILFPSSISRFQSFMRLLKMPSNTRILFFTNLDTVLVDFSPAL